MDADPPPDAERRSALAIDMNVFIPSAITNLAQRIASSATAAYLPRWGVGITDWRILALLAAAPWTAPVEIGEATGLDKAAVSRALRGLIDKEFVEMCADETRRRRQPLALTRAGLAVHDEIVTLARQREARLLTGFTTQERAQLSDFLARLGREAAQL